MLTLLIGGARSGKSSLAVRLAERHGGGVTLIATCPRIDGDDDLETRIERHRAERPTTWTTLEVELDLGAAIRSAGDDLVVVDCLTLWVNNLLHHGVDEATALDANRDAIDAAVRRTPPTVVISNEVGLGIVPGDAVSRSYRDLLGTVNQRWVASADRALLMVAGRALPLHEVDGLL